MLQRLLIVRAPSVAVRSVLDDLCEKEHDLLCEYVEWDSRLSERIRGSRCDLVVLEASSSIDTAEVISSLREDPVGVPTLAILPEDAADESIRLVSLVLDDFIVAPVRRRELRHRIGRLLGSMIDSVTTTHTRLLQELTLAGLVGRNPAFLGMISKIPLAARSNGPAFIVGETGTGKELCARAIHSLGPRRDFPFIPVDCAALPDNLLESEMFGHVRGAFTDARQDQKGLVALADGGTLFLDEIDSLSLSAQSKLLRFLEERSYRPLGSERFIKLNVNVVAATNSDLQTMIRGKQFRADLFFRLNVFRIFLVPLRERRDDIPLLVRHFVKRVCLENGVALKVVTPAALRRLCHYDWPGNVRELFNVIQRAVVFFEGDQILASHVEGADETSEGGMTETARHSFREARTRAIASFERHYVEELMRECSGNISRAARIAQKDRRAFGRLVKRYDIRREGL